VPLSNVTIEDAFWSPRLEINREKTIPFEYTQCKETGRIDALRLQWKPGDVPVPHPFWDSDVAKWIEAASYSLATHPDPHLDALVDETIALLASAQQPDGYLNTYFTVVKPGERWTDLRDAHELYCAGHLIEAGVAHYQATGKRTLLDVVSRYADCIDTVFGRGPGQKRGYCGHEEIELALVKLYRATGIERYLRLAQYFVDERGQQPNYFEVETANRATPGYFEAHRSHGPLRTSWQYSQSHVPVRDQQEAVGHAVRAMYLYSAMADLAGEIGDETLRAACRRLWDHLCSKRLYVTGGIGSSRENEGFTQDYDLPNERAYAETCAAIGLVFWAYRMVQLEGGSRYADVLEQALYNGVLSGVSLDGTRFFYENPLASHGGVGRKKWFGVSCCPPNIARLLASLGQYIYSSQESGVAVHLYVQGSLSFHVQGRAIVLRQETAYPRDGRVTLTVRPDQPTDFTLALRVPGWCRRVGLSVNGCAVDVEAVLEKGYAHLTRTWVEGDVVQLDLAMPVERVYAHPKVLEDVGRVALRRGPLVYCLEEVDNHIAPDRLAVVADGDLDVQDAPSLLGGIMVVQGAAREVDDCDWNGLLYRHERPRAEARTITAVPYYAWGNRENGQMSVWVREVSGGDDKHID
jgi:DUF1680 family protein